MEKIAGRMRKMIWVSVVIMALFLAGMYNIGVKVDYIRWTDQIEAYEGLLNIGFAVSAICFSAMILLYMIIKQRKIAFFLCAGVLCISVIMLVYSFVSTPNWEKLWEQQEAEDKQTSQVM